MIWPFVKVKLSGFSPVAGLQKVHRKIRGGKAGRKAHLMRKRGGGSVRADGDGEPKLRRGGQGSHENGGCDPIRENADGAGAGESQQKAPLRPRLRRRRQQGNRPGFRVQGPAGRRVKHMPNDDGRFGRKRQGVDGAGVIGRGKNGRIFLRQMGGLFGRGKIHQHMQDQGRLRQPQPGNGADAGGNEFAFAAEDSGAGSRPHPPVGQGLYFGRTRNLLKPHVGIGGVRLFKIVNVRPHRPRIG